MKILIINGPNINMIGIREPNIYGTDSYDELVKQCLNKGKEIGVEIEVFQSNHEGEIIDKIQNAYGNTDGIAINAGAYTHTSIAIMDALKAVSIPTVEVHLSDPSTREEFRHISYIGLVAFDKVVGKGISGYSEAISLLFEKLK